MWAGLIGVVVGAFLGTFAMVVATCGERARGGATWWRRFAISAAVGGALFALIEGLDQLLPGVAFGLAVCSSVVLAEQLGLATVRAGTYVSDRR